MMMWHENVRNGARVALWNLKRGHNHGNEWWLFSHDGQPIESWSTKDRAIFYGEQQSEFRHKHKMPGVQLYRCLPGVGFILIRRWK